MSRKKNKDRTQSLHINSVPKIENKSVKKKNMYLCVVSLPENSKVATGAHDHLQLLQFVISMGV